MKGISRENTVRCFVCASRLTLRIFGPKRVEVKGEWRKLHNEELHDLYSSPTTVWVIISRRMIWAGHIARREGGKRRVQGFGGET
jgi:hypothetical protein